MCDACKYGPFKKMMGTNYGTNIAVTRDGEKTVLIIFPEEGGHLVVPMTKGNALHLAKLLDS